MIVYQRCANCEKIIAGGAEYHIEFDGGDAGQIKFHGTITMTQDGRRVWVCEDCAIKDMKHRIRPLSEHF